MGRYRLWVVAVFCLLITLPALGSSQQMLVFSVNSDVVTVDDAEVKMEKPAIQIGDETFVPVEFLADRVDGISLEKISEDEQDKLKLMLGDRFEIKMPLDDYNVICQIAGILEKYVDLNLCDVASKLLKSEDEPTDEEIKELLAAYDIQADSYITKRFTTYKWDYLFESLKYQLEKMSDELEGGKLIGLATNEKTGGYLEVALIVLDAQREYCPNIPMIEYPFYKQNELSLYSFLKQDKILIITTIYHWNAAHNEIFGIMEALHREFEGENVSVVTAFLSEFIFGDLDGLCVDSRKGIDSGYHTANPWLRKNGFKVIEGKDITHHAAIFIDGAYNHGVEPLGIDGQRKMLIITPNKKIVARFDFDRYRLNRDDFELVRNAIQTYLDSQDEGGES